MIPHTQRLRPNRQQTKRPALFAEQLQEMIAQQNLSPINTKMLQCAIDCGWTNTLPLFFSYQPFAHILTSLLSQYVN